MNTEKVFAKMVKFHSKGEPVTLVTDYENAKVVAKFLLAMPNTFIEAFALWDELQDGYGKAWLLSLCENGAVYCEKAFFDNGGIAQGDGNYIIDTNAIGDAIPSDFVLSDSKVITI